MAQLVEQRTCNAQVIGSNPIVGSIIYAINLLKTLYGIKEVFLLIYPQIFAGIIL